MSGAIVGRGRPGATTVPHWRLEDTTLDAAEFRIASWLASHADRYCAEKVSRNQIALKLGMSRSKVSAACQRLVEMKIIEIEDDDGRWRITVDFDVWEGRTVGRPASTPLDAQRPEVGRPASTTRELQVEEQEENPPLPPQGGAGEEGVADFVSFDAFWAMYPRHEAKSTAVKAWGKLKPDDRRACLELTPPWLNWKRVGRTAEEFMRYIPHPTTFLNQRRWEDEIEVLKTTGARARAQAAWLERRGK